MLIPEKLLEDSLTRRDLLFLRRDSLLESFDLWGCLIDLWRRVLERLVLLPLPTGLISTDFRSQIPELSRLALGPTRRILVRRPGYAEIGLRFLDPFLLLVCPLPNVLCLCLYCVELSL